MYHLVLLIVAVVALFVGFRKGLVGQLAGLLGIVFGVVAVHLFGDSVEPYVREWLPSFADSFLADYIYNVITGAVVFLAVYLVMQLLSVLFNTMVAMLNLGIVNSLAGSVFCLFKYMMVCSVLLNIVACVDSESSLVDSCKADDGNVVGVVMGLAPAILGTESPEDLIYRSQKEDSESISCNNSRSLCVKVYYSNSFIAQYSNA